MNFMRHFYNELGRRQFLKHAGASALALGALSLSSGEIKAQGSNQTGAGIYILPGPDGFQHATDSTKEVFLTTPFAFDVASNYISCIAIANTDPFIFPSAGLGDVVIPQFGFFMEMVGSPDILEPDGRPTGIQEAQVTGNRITLTGRVRSITQLLLPAPDGPITTVEFVNFTATAVDNATPGADLDTFEMTVGFQLPFGENVQRLDIGLQDEIGGQVAIFGPDAVFGGIITTGNIQI